MNENIKTLVESADGDAVKLTITVDAKEVSRYIAAAYREVSTRYRFPGFRPGKAPRSVIDSAMGGKDAILGAATDNLVEDVFPLACDKEELIVTKQPELKAPKLVEEGQEYSFTVVVDIKPSFELSSYEPVEVELPIAEITQEDMDEQIQRLREQYYDYQEVDRELQADDIATLTIKATCNGEEDAAVSCENRPYSLSSSLLGEDFDKQILGMKAGDDKSFSFDKDGETVDCEVHMDKVSVKHFPEVDDAFALKTGCSSLSHLKVIVYDALKESKEAAASSLKYNRCVSALAERLQGTVPEADVQNFFQDMMKRFFQQLQDGGMTLDDYLAEQEINYDQFQAEILAQAQDSAREAYALDAVAKHFGFQVNKFDISRYLLDAGVEDPAALRDQFEKSGQMGYLKESILRNKAADWVVDNAVITEIGEPYDIQPDRMASKNARFNIPMDFLSDVDDAIDASPVVDEPAEEPAVEEAPAAEEAATEEAAE